MRTSNDTTLATYSAINKISPLNKKIALAIDKYMALISFALHVKPFPEVEYLDEYLISRLNEFYSSISNRRMLTRESLNIRIYEFEQIAMDVDERIKSAIKDMSDLDENFKKQIAETVDIVSFEIIYNLKKITPYCNENGGNSPDYSVEHDLGIPVPLATHENYTFALDYKILYDLLEQLDEDPDERIQVLEEDKAATEEAYTLITEMIQPRLQRNKIREQLIALKNNFSVQEDTDQVIRKQLVQLKTKIISSYQTTSRNEKGGSDVEMAAMQDQPREKVQSSRSEPKAMFSSFRLQHHRKNSLWVHVNSNSYSDRQRPCQKTEKEDNCMSNS